METSWVESANDGVSGFPLQNLPFGVFSTRSLDPRIGVAIGDLILDIRACAEHGLFRELSPLVQQACTASTLNRLMSYGRQASSPLRARLSEMLRADTASEIRNRIERLLYRAAETTMHLPAAVGDYTDFYASIYHATNVGRLFRPDNPLLANYKYVPIGYHGRASSIVLSGAEVKRPNGQTKSADEENPVFGPSRLLDYELEVGFFIGKGNIQGETVPLNDAESHIFGLCLVNDWSARDIQAWEYQPLGPFLAKNFATTISPWVVTMDALAPFRVHAFEREAGDPARCRTSALRWIKSKAASISHSRSGSRPSVCAKQDNHLYGSAKEMRAICIGHWPKCLLITQVMAVACNRVICWHQGQSRVRRKNLQVVCWR